ncbi:HNH endonuclease [Acinetobacter sp.]|uniref:HNH endonuclease n=1 Tax=Acinetobacter sp. TaxID=472 RepID=UPI00388F1693
MVSTIQTAPIIAVKGHSAAAKRMHKAPSLTNRELFRRDRHMCAYCGKTFSDIKLTRDHVIPTSKGGPDKWTNVVTACESCNHKKDDQLLEECGMKLLYVPYTPNRAEALILENRKVLDCQMEYLKSFLPEHSRVWEELKA